jgi:hypothetical protein
MYPEKCLRGLTSETTNFGMTHNDGRGNGVYLRS